MILRITLFCLQACLLVLLCVRCRLLWFRLYLAAGLLGSLPYLGLTPVGHMGGTPWGHAFRWIEPVSLVLRLAACLEALQPLASRWASWYARVVLVWLAGLGAAAGWLLWQLRGDRDWFAVARDLRSAEFLGLVVAAWFVWVLAIDRQRPMRDWIERFRLWHAALFTVLLTEHALLDLGWQLNRIRQSWWALDAGHYWLMIGLTGLWIVVALKERSTAIGKWQD